jgi:hypothetical protein
LEVVSENPRVGSSILSLGTNEIKGLAKLAKPFFHFTVNLPHFCPTFSVNRNRNIVLCSAFRILT